MHRAWQGARVDGDKRQSISRGEIGMADTIWLVVTSDLPDGITLK